MNEEDNASSGNEWVEGLIDWLSTRGIEVGLQVLFAIVIFVVGKWIAGFIRNKLRKTMQKRDVDPALVSFGTRWQVKHHRYYCQLSRVWPRRQRPAAPLFRRDRCSA